MELLSSLKNLFYNIIPIVLVGVAYHNAFSVFLEENISLYYRSIQVSIVSSLILVAYNIRTRCYDERMVALSVVSMMFFFGMTTYLIYGDVPNLDKNSALYSYIVEVYHSSIKVQVNYILLSEFLKGVERLVIG